MQPPCHAVARPVNRVIDKIVSFIVKIGKKIWAKFANRKTTAKDQATTGTSKADTRTRTQKEQDLKTALKTAHQLLTRGELAGTIKSKLVDIKSRYNLTQLNFVVDEKRKGEQLVHVEGIINPGGSTDREPVPLDEIHRAIAQNGGNPGNKIGQGGFGAVYEVPGMPHLAIKVAIGGGMNPQISKKAESLQLLRSHGVPTPYKGRLEWTDAEGRQHAGI